MKRTVMMLTLAAVVVSLTGCQSCKHFFGLDRRCEQPAPPPQYSSTPPVYSGPANYAPAPCASPVPGSCAAPK